VTALAIAETSALHIKEFIQEGENSATSDDGNGSVTRLGESRDQSTMTKQVKQPKGKSWNCDLTVIDSKIAENSCKDP